MKIDEQLGVIKKYVEDATGIADISENNRVRHYTYAREAYYTISLEKTLTSIMRCSRFINRTHATVMHSRNHTHNHLPDSFVDLIRDFNPLCLLDLEDSKSDTYNELRKSEGRLKRERIKVSVLNREVENLKKDMSNLISGRFSAKLTDFMNGLDFDARLGIEKRIEAIITMETRKRTYERNKV